MCTEHLHQPTAGQNHLAQSPFYNEVLDISWNYWIPYWTWKTMAAWVQNHCMVVYTHDHGAEWALWLLPVPSIRREYALPTSSLGKRSNSDTDFHWVHVAFIPLLKLRKVYRAIRQLGTVCILDLCQTELGWWSISYKGQLSAKDSTTNSMNSPQVVCSTIRDLQAKKGVTSDKGRTK